MKKMILDLGAKAISAETCKLDAIVTTLRSGSIFLKEYWQGRIYENLSKKLKNKKFAQ